MYSLNPLTYIAGTDITTHMSNRFSSLLGRYCRGQSIEAEPFYAVAGTMNSVKFMATCPI